MKVETLGHRPPRLAGDGRGAASRPASTWLRYAPLVLILLALGIGFALGLHEHLSLNSLAARRAQLAAYVAGNLLLAAATYMGVYVVAVTLSFPGASALTMAGGLMFGWKLGGALAAVSATIGACAIFLVARTSLGDHLRARAGERLRGLQRGIQEDGFFYLLSIRLTPLPFWIVNLAAGVFGMRLAPYALATALGILPGTFAYAYFGESLGTAIDGERPELSPQLLAGFVALALAALVPVLVKRWNRRRNAASQP